MTYIDLALLSLAIAVVALARKQRKQGIRMSKVQDFLAEVNEETNQISARIDALIAKQDAGEQLTPEDFDGMRAFSARLKVLASDPANPVPAPAPEPTSEPAPDAPPAV